MPDQQPGRYATQLFVHIHYQYLMPCPKIEQQTAGFELTSVPKGNGRHIGIHIEYLPNLGRHLDHAGVAKVDRVALFSPFPRPPESIR